MSVTQTEVSADLETRLRDLAADALAVSRQLATLPTERKNAVLTTLAERIEASREALQSANARDLEAGEAAGLSQPMLDRLRLTDARIAQMAEGVRQVAALPDPVGEVIESSQRPQGFELQRVRVPIGVIGIIYESRPNVTIDCAALCLKSGNATLLRGGKEAWHSNQALAALVGDALEAHDVPRAAVQLIPTTDRAALSILLKLDAYIHCLIPRGGEGLIRFVAEHARMPVIKHYKGVCNVYLDAAADAAMAEAVVLNAKVQRTSVCNAAENLFLHASLVQTLWPRIAQALVEAGVELRCDAESGAALDAAGLPWQPATEADFHEEFLDKVLAVKTVPDLAAAIDGIHTYGSAHTEAIVTADAATAEAFLQGVDAASVFWNLSTRFSDGFEYGLGAEIGISTDKLHARGPMGLRELTTYKFVARGHGETR